MKLVKTFIKRNIAGECILVPTGDTAKDYNGILTLSETGEFLWDHIEQAESFEHLVQLLEDEFEVDHETAWNDTAEYMSRLVSAGFVQMENAEQGW